MILRRLGNKKKIAKEIQKHFPPHNIYIEPFFGAGGMFFNKPKVKYNIVNDLDSDVFNLFQVVMNQKEELEKAFYIMPIHSDLLEYWKKNQETDPIKKALRFLFLSNFTFLGKGDTQSNGATNDKMICHRGIKDTFELIYDVRFTNYDFIKFLKSIKYRNLQQKTLIYNDPPYLDTDSNYENKGQWNEEESFNLFEANEQTDCKFAMSEFNHPFIIEQAKERNLNIITIGERQNLKNRRTEILITNYENQQMKLF